MQHGADLNKACHGNDKNRERGNEVIVLEVAVLRAMAGQTEEPSEPGLTLAGCSLRPARSRRTMSRVRCLRRQATPSGHQPCRKASHTRASGSRFTCRYGQSALLHAPCESTSDNDVERYDRRRCLCESSASGYDQRHLHPIGSCTQHACKDINTPEGTDLEEERADGHELGAQLVLQRAGVVGAAALQPLGAHRHLAAVVHVLAPRPLLALSGPAHPWTLAV